MKKIVEELPVGVYESKHALLDDGRVVEILGSMPPQKECTMVFYIDSTIPDSNVSYSSYSSPIGEPAFSKAVRLELKKGRLDPLFAKYINKDLNEEIGSLVSEIDRLEGILVTL